MESKEVLQDSETAVMKYYLIYEQLPSENKNYGIYGSWDRCIYIVEHEEVAKDFCKKNYGFYYEEVKIEK